jgi:predicted MFS family arabinose efflux permease
VNPNIATTQAEAPAVWSLALGQTLTYAGVFYAFPALLPDLLTMTGWSEAALAAGPTLSFLVMAALTPFTGRLVDRGFGGEMLIWLAALAAVCVAVLGFAPNFVVWIAIWAVLGVAQAGILYDTCFAFLIRRLGARARPAIIRVTLIAGLAGTFAFPLAHWLAAQIGPALTLSVFAALILFGSVPLNAFAVRRLRQIERPDASPQAAIDPTITRRAMRKPPFWALSGMYGVLWLAHGIVITFILILFAERGAAPGLATLAAACIGPSQVLGRLILLMNERRVNNAMATLISVFSLNLAALALMIAGSAPWMIFAFAALQGAGIGILSILRPVLIAQTLGRTGFGAISGAIAVSPILATALGPSVGAWVLALGGAGAVYGLVLALALSGLGLAFWLTRLGLDLTETR